MNPFLLQRFTRSSIFGLEEAELTALPAAADVFAPLRIEAREMKPVVLSAFVDERRETMAMMRMKLKDTTTAEN